MWNVAQTTGIATGYWRRRKRYITPSSVTASLAYFWLLFYPSDKTNFETISRPMKSIFITCYIPLYPKLLFTLITPPVAFTFFQWCVTDAFDWKEFHLHTRPIRLCFTIFYSAISLDLYKWRTYCWLLWHHPGLVSHLYKWRTLYRFLCPPSYWAVYLSDILFGLLLSHFCKRRTSHSFLWDIIIQFSTLEQTASACF